MLGNTATHQWSQAASQVLLPGDAQEVTTGRLHCDPKSLLVQWKFLTEIFRWLDPGASSDFAPVSDHTLYVPKAAVPYKPQTLTFLDLFHPDLLIFP